jgi:hypothetical protein
VLLSACSKKKQDDDDTFLKKGSSSTIKSAMSRILFVLAFYFH